MIMRASRSVEKFYPELREVFICPICLRRRPVDDISEITQAHILPKAAGGRWTTLLCRRCDNTFGTHQDKWFGEYLNLIKSPSPDIFRAKHQAGHFHISGQRVNGRYRVKANREIEFLVVVQDNSPEAMRAFDLKMAEARAKGSFRVSLPVPIMQNRQLIDAAFLTAAYLLWFRELGYSWALQSHLDPIREQIRKPDQQLLPKSFSAACPGAFFEPPWIGTGYIAGQLVLMTAIASRMVFFPPADHPDTYALLPEDLSGLEIDGRILHRSHHNEFYGPVGLLIGDRMVVAPDVVLRGGIAEAMIRFTPGGGKPDVLRPVSEEEFEQMAQQPNAAINNVQPDVRIPATDTGR